MQCSDAKSASGDPVLDKGRRTAPQPAADAPKCDSCGSGRLARTQVDMAFWSGGRMVLVENVPALVCNACGEQYTEDRTAMQLDQLRAADFSHARQTGERTIPVFAYPGGPDDAT